MNEKRYPELTSFFCEDEDGGRRMGYLDADGKEHIPPVYYMKATGSDGKVIFNDDGEFKNGLAVVMDRNGRFGLIDRNGGIVIPLLYGSISNVLANNIVFFRKGGTCGFMKTDETVLAEYPDCTALQEIRAHVYEIEYDGGAKKTELNLDLIG